MAAHTHAPAGTNFVNNYVGVSGLQTGGSARAGDAGLTTTATASAGSGAAFNVIQPTRAALLCIKT
jgi:hypothetical protein